MGMLDMISKTSLNEIQADYIQTIQGASENLLNIINDILDLTKIEAGKMDLKISTLDIYETANKIKRLFEETAKNKKIDFTVNIEKNVVKYIKTDENRLIQIISNLVSNAFKFTKKGSIKVNISMANQNNEGILFLVEVIDTGIGITENDQIKLFTKFSQLDNTLTRSYDGTGLGLAISKELAELIGGEIGVKSEYNKGSTFWFTFTATVSSEPDYTLVKFSHPNFKDMKFNLTVLLVEDKFVNQKVETLMLENAGCKVSIAKNGKEAVDIISAGNKFDIIFMDIQMPVMDGVEAVSILRKKYNYLPPIIGLSANALEGDAERYIKLGMDDYVSKPFTSEQIREKLFKWSPPKKI
jgi:CheY-like chemotaxis protein/two-component sensor histidine kinase